MIYVLAYPSFDPVAATRIAQFRTTNEPMRAKLVAPHVTLVFGVDTKYAPELIVRCRDLAALTPAFTVTFASVTGVHDPFEDSYKLFLVCDSGADILTGLHERLYAEPLQQELDANHPFRPHMTVATQATRTELDRLDPDLLGPLPITAQATAFDVVEQTNGTLRAITTVPLLQ